jgi:site-specific recombinase XerD
MTLTNSIVNYRRYLKRKNYAPHTIKNYLHSLKEFVLWLDVPIEEVTPKKIIHYIDSLRRRRLKPKTINCHLQRIRQFYYYLSREEQVPPANPVKKNHSLRMPKPLPRPLREEELETLFSVVDNKRDRAMFMLMLRSGLRVEEVANLTLGAVNLKLQSIIVYDSKWGKDRVAYVSDDALKTLIDYLRLRPASKAKKLFLVQKGTYRTKPLSVRGIQKRMEYYAKKTGLSVSCHNLRHTWAEQMLNADAELETIQDILGHSWITTTQRYCRLSNQKVRKDYFRTMAIVMQRTGDVPLDP